MSACTCEPAIDGTEIFRRIVHQIERSGSDAFTIDADETMTLSGTLRCASCGQWFVWNVNLMTLPHDPRLGYRAPTETPR